MKPTAFVYRSPDGKSRGEVDLSRLKPLFERPDPAFWAAGSGEVGFEYDRPVPRSMLTASYCGAFGFYVVYGTYDAVDDYVLHTPGPTGGSIEVIIGGDPRVLPRSVCVTAEVAWRAVVGYCSTGEMAPGLPWVRLDAVAFPI